MAKKNSFLIKLTSSAIKTAKANKKKSTGFFYIKKRNPKKHTKKLELRKYDPIIRKHVLFKEEKLR